jgi:hypothetical protein
MLSIVMAISHKWNRLMKHIRIRTIQKHIKDYYRSIILKCSKHAEDLYDKRILRRYHYNDIVKRIYTVNEKMKKEICVHRDINEIKEIVNHIVYTIGLPNVSDILLYLDAPTIPDEHASWIENITTPCLISKEKGKCSRIFFRNIPLTNPNSYTDNQCIWASLPLNDTSHIVLKLIIGRDPTNLIQRAFSSRIRILSKLHRSLLWAIHPRHIITSSTSELRLRIQGLLKMRKRIGNTPVSKLIKEFLDADTNQQVTLFCAMCIPEKACRPPSQPQVNNTRVSFGISFSLIGSDDNT